jgi:peptidoglycan-associated lipoprotein
MTLVVMTALAAGCAPRASKKSAADKDAADRAAAEALQNPGVDAEEASLRGGEFKSIEGLMPIRFEYDSALLKEEALSALKKNASYLKSNKQLQVLVAGFCDERGTVEYNLALGQKRAKAVREYYIRLGVNGRNVATISYGKEAPVCEESTEDCWSQNRRAETRVRASNAGR